MAHLPEDAWQDFVAGAVVRLRRWKARRRQRAEAGTHAGRLLTLRLAWETLEDDPHADPAAVHAAFVAYNIALLDRP